MAGRGYATAVARGIAAGFTSLWRAVRRPRVGAARPARAAMLQLMTALALIGGLSAIQSPAQARTETFTSTYRNVANQGQGLFTVGGATVLFYQPLTGNHTVFASAVSIPAGRRYYSAGIEHTQGSLSDPAGATVGISLLSGLPTGDLAGQDQLRAGPRVGDWTLSTGAGTIPLSQAVVDEMNRLSAAGGGTLYLGTFFSSARSAVSVTFTRFQLVAELELSVTISSLSSTSGPAAGNTTVTLSGTDLATATGVTFGGAPASIISKSANQITVTTPAHAAGSVDVVVTTPGGVATRSNGYTYIAAPMISSVFPEIDRTAGGRPITLTGTNLSGTSAVTFGGTAGTITANSATELTVTAPPHAEGAVDVIVTTPGGGATLTGGFTYADAPTASAFTAAAVAYNTGSASTTGIELAPHISGTADVYGLNNGGSPIGLITTANGGRASVNAATGHVDYTPPAGFRGNDSFQYRASNHGDASGWATVTVPVSDPVFTVTLPETTGLVGQEYNLSNTPVVISGGTGPYTITSVTGYPASLEFDLATQVLSGHIGRSGTSTVSFTITDNSTGAGPYTATVSATLVTSMPPLPTANGFTAPAVAYNTGSASATILSTAPHASGVINGYFLNDGVRPTTSVATAHGGSASIDRDTGQVSYTPPVGFRGDDSFEFHVSNASGSSDRATVTVPVSDPVFTVTLPETTGMVGVDYNTSNAPITISGGRGPYTVTAATGYPRVLDFNAATQVLAGRVTINGTFAVTFTITDSSTGTGPYTSTASATLVTAFPATPTAGAFTAPAVGYNTGSASATIIQTAPYGGGIVDRYYVNDGGVGRLSAATAQGGRVEIEESTGRVSYTPPVGFRGDDSFQYQTANTGGRSGWATVTVPVSDPVFTVTLPETTGQIGVDYNTAHTPITISGGQGPYTVTAVNGYPRSLSFNASTQVLSGDVGEDGTWPITFTITDSSRGTGPATSTASATLVTTFPPYPTATGFTAPAVAYNRGSAAATTIDVKPYADGVIGGYFLADGVYAAISVTTEGGGSATIEHRTGLVTYTAPVGFRGDDSFRYYAENANGRSALVIVTVPVSDPVFTVALPSASGTVGVAYNGGGAVVTVSGGAAPYGAFSATGLPAGLTMSSAGVISGVPTTAGNATVVVTATDSSTGAGAYTSTATASISIAAPTITLTPAAGALPGGVGGVAYSQTFTSTGGIAPIRYGVSAGALPPGLGLSSGGVLDGAPTATGTFNFTVTATDGSGNAYTGSAAYSITVAAPTITFGAPAAGALPGGLRTVAYSQTFTATGGTGPYAYAVTTGALPPGLTLDADGVLSGAPTTAGSNSFTITATDAFGFTGEAAYTLEVGTPVPTVQPQTATVVGGHSVTIDVTQGAVGLDFTSVSVASPPSNGTAVVQGMTIVYTANGPFFGTDSFTYTVNNAGGASAPGTVTITVTPAVVAGPVKRATVLAGRTATVELTEGATGAPFTGAAVVSVGPTDAGTATITPRAGPGGVQLYDLVFTPADAFTGEATVLYTLDNAFATSAPGTVILTVEARPDPGLDPEVRGVATGQVTAARRFADTQISNFQRRLQALRNGTNGSSNGLSLNFGLGGSDEDRDPRAALRRELGQQASRLDPGALNDDRDRDWLGMDLWAERSPTEVTPSSATGERLNAAPTPAGEGGGRSVGFWTAGSIDWGRQDATGRRDNRFTTQGVTAGLDIRVSDQLILGGGLGYGEDKTRIGDNGSLTEGRAFTGALYASWRPAEAFYIDGVIGFADLDLSSRRWVEGLGGDPDGYADGSRSGDVLFASAAFGRVIRSEGLVTDLYARLDTREMTLDAFTETGGGMAALSWDSLDQSSLSANLGATLRWNVETRRHGLIRPSARLEWSHELEDIGAQGVRYADWAASPTYLVPLDDWSRDAVNLDLGMEWSLTDRLMFSLGYRAMLGDASSSQGGQIGLKYGW